MYTYISCLLTRGQAVCACLCSAALPSLCRTSTLCPTNNCTNLFTVIVDVDEMCAATPPADCCSAPRRRDCELELTAGTIHWHKDKGHTGAY